nr:uncharacterized protein LOC127311506 [Lolium perenne]
MYGVSIAMPATLVQLRHTLDGLVPKGTKYTGESQILRRVLEFHIAVSWLHLPPCQNHRCGMGASTSQKAGSTAIGRAKADEVVFWLVLRWLRVREMLTRIEMLIGSWKVLWLDKHSSLLDPGGVPDEAEPLERGTSLNWMDMNELILGCMSTESTSSVPLLKKWRQELACEALLG